jgi:hypothetical protein
MRLGSVPLVACGLALAGCFHPPPGRLRQDVQYRIRDLAFAEVRSHGSTAGLTLRDVHAIHVTCFPQRRDEFACGVRLVTRDGRAYRERWRARYLAASRDERMHRISGSILAEARRAGAP